MIRTWAVLAVLALLPSATPLAGDLNAPSLRRSEASIREWMLRQVPLGSSMEDVGAMVERFGWKDYQIDRSGGFLDQRTKPAKVTGAKSISAELGEYRTFFYVVNVSAFWAFDERGFLTDVWVWKTSE